MRLRSLRDAEVGGRRVLVRVDFNVPIHNGSITDDTRIRASLPTIQHLVDRGAKIVLVSHLGRPKGGRDDAFSLGPAAARLSVLLDRPVQIARDVVGPDAAAKLAELATGEVLVLENVRFEPGEEKNDPALARQLASFAELYVNDAFGTAHRAHASTVGVADFLPAYAGFLIEREVESLGRLLDRPEHPFVAIVGGAKVSDKLAVLANLLERVDSLLVGGGMANTFLLAQGKQIGTSLAEPDRVPDAQALLQRAIETGRQILLPVDVVVAASPDGTPRTLPVGNVPSDEAIFDIGPATVSGFAAQIANAKTIFWNGPMGMFERPAFAAGTKGVAEAVARSTAFSVVGGGDSVAALEQMGLADEISHISTGGGASLEFVEGRTLPGVAVLEVREGR